MPELGRCRQGCLAMRARQIWRPVESSFLSVIHILCSLVPKHTTLRSKALSRILYISIRLSRGALDACDHDDERGGHHDRSRSVDPTAVTIAFVFSPSRLAVKLLECLVHIDIVSACAFARSLPSPPSQRYRPASTYAAFIRPQTPPSTQHHTTRYTHRILFKPQVTTMPRRLPPTPLRLHNGPLPARGKPKHTLPSLPRPVFYGPTPIAATTAARAVPRARMTHAELPALVIPEAATATIPFSAVSAMTAVEPSWSGPSSPTSASSTASSKKSREFVRGPWDHSGSIQVPIDVGAMLPPPMPAAINVRGEARVRLRVGDGWCEGCEERFWCGRSLTHYAYAWSYESSDDMHSFVSVVVCMCVAVCFLRLQVRGQAIMQVEYRT
ncbi:hypothetical protein C8Q74DRAFT_52637 [Fomes fomentarius]|nr:hypothetical protein C8Q74DRAFT_52637 [Fomes fomentarius]